MKHPKQLFLVAAFSLFFCGSAIAQETTVDDFLDIPWGSSAAKVESAMLKREGVTIDKENSDTSHLFFDGGTFIGRSVEYYMFNTYPSTGLNTASVFFEKPLEAKVIEKYDEIKAVIIKKFGKPDNDFKYFKSPYEEGDGYETSAIRQGKGTIMTYWKKQDKNGGNVLLMLQITESLQIMLSYQNAALFDKYKQDKEAKNQSDL
ncbi:MAG: hypothetical protein JNJ94_07705 [Chlorobi bacterium]|nr:hypothetical protein [Chlorobiota bacterium]